MTFFFYPSMRHATAAEAGFAMVRFLCNELPGSTGPDYTVIEADDGTNINTGPNLSDLGVSNLWNPANGSPAVGAWVVLETLNSNNTNHTQWFFQITSTTTWAFFMVPIQDFATGGGSTGGSLPTLPTTAYGDANNQTSPVDMTVTNGVARYSIVATEGHLMVLHHSSVAMSWYYAGEVDSPDAAAPTPDDRAYIHYWKTARAYVDGSASQEMWIRLSPVDKTTIIGYLNDDSKWAIFKGQAERVPTFPASDERGTVNGNDPYFPVGVYFRTTGHDHFTGFLRGLATTHPSLGRIKLNDDKSFLHLCGQLTETGIAMTWDGTTAYG